MNFGRSFWLLRLSALCISTVSLAPALYAATVHGSVLGTDGKPIAKATVLVLTSNGKPPVSIQTSEDGTWTGEVPDLAAPDTKAPPEPFADFVGALVIAPGRGFGGKIGKRGDTFDVVLPNPTSIGGVVQDEKGMPLPGVVVRLQGFYTTAFNPPGENKETMIPIDILGTGLNPTLASALSFKTDDEGKWSFDGIPQGMRVSLTLLDERFTIADVNVRSSTLDTIIKATPGAAIKGRVLLPDGKPAVGVQIFSGKKSSQTDAEGRFTLTSLTVGKSSVYFSAKSKEWVPAVQEIESLKPGEIRDIGDVKLSSGIRLLGQVVDETGKGLADAKVTVDGNTLTTGADGRFQMQASPGKSWLTATKTAYLGPSGYGEQVQQQITIASTEMEHQLEPVKLQRGVYVSGMVLDEAGQPAAGVELNSGTRWDNPGVAIVKKDGSFLFGPLLPGKEVTLHASGTWDLTQETKLTAPTLAQEARAPKLSLRVKKIELLTVTGRIVTPEGTPVAGVVSHFRVYSDSKRNSWSDRDVTSDDKGQVSFDSLRPENSPEFDHIDAGQYVLIKSPTPARQGKQWNVGDIVVSPLDGQITGQILDAAGLPVGGAQIALAGHYPLTIISSDLKGQFTLDKLPRGEVTLLVASGHNFARQTVKVGSDVRVVLQERPTPTRSDGEKLLLSKRGTYPQLASAGAVPALDPDFALSLLPPIGAGVEGAGSPAPAQVATLIVDLAQHDAAKAIAWGLPLWEKLPPKNRTLEKQVQLASALLKANREFAVNGLAQAQTQMDRHDFSAEAAQNYFALAGLAGLLKDTAANTLLDLGLTATDQSILGDKRIKAATNWGKAVATSPALVARLTEEMKPQEELSALSGAIQTMAPLNLPAAQKLLARMMELRQDKAIKASDAQQEAQRQQGGVWQQTSEEMMSRAQGAIALAMAAKPGPEALAFIKQISYASQRQKTLLQVARRFLNDGNAVDATATLRALGSEENQWSDNSVAGAGIALTFDKPLALELFDKEYHRILGDQYSSSTDYRPSSAGYAFYHAPLDAAQARIILENEWQWLQTVKSSHPSQNDDNRSWQKRPLALAMGALDLSRALEMLGQIKDPYDENNDILWKIGLYLATDGKISPFGPEENSDF